MAGVHRELWLRWDVSPVVTGKVPDAQGVRLETNPPSASARKQDRSCSTVNPILQTPEVQGPLETLACFRIHTCVTCSQGL